MKHSSQPVTYFAHFRNTIDFKNVRDTTENYDYEDRGTDDGEGFGDTNDIFVNIAKRESEEIDRIGDIFTDYCEIR